MHITLTTLTTWNTCVIQNILITLITPTTLITPLHLVQPRTTLYSTVLPRADQCSPVESSTAKFPHLSVQKLLSLLCLIFNCEWLAVLKWYGVVIKLLSWLQCCMSYFHISFIYLEEHSISSPVHLPVRNNFPPPFSLPSSAHPKAEGCGSKVRIICFYKI